MEKIRKIKATIKNNRLIYFCLIFFLIFIVHLYIFRGIVLDLPSLINGESLIVREELIPFFNFDTQLLDQIKGGKSSLTMTDEIRVAYSFWTSWVRYSPVLPFAIVLLNSISAFIFFIAVYMIVREVFKGQFNFIASVSFLTSFFIFLLLLYSKITHFYTLIFGFSLLSLAISMTLREFFFRSKFSLRSTSYISLLVLLNPAIHYHLVYYIVSALAVSFLLLTSSSLREDAVRLIKYFIVITLLSIIPYTAFILYVISNTSSDIANTIPVNFLSIFYASTSLVNIFSFDIAAPVDMFLYGYYIADVPHYTKMIFFFILLLPLFFIKDSIFKKAKKFITFSYFILIVSIGMSIGYSDNFSFHNIIAEFMFFLSNFSSWGTDILKKLIGTTIQILRAPERFEFILFYIAPILATISFVSLRNKVGYHLVLALIFISVCLTFVSNVDYRTFLFSGNYGGFLSPMNVPVDLKTIKNIINDDPGTGFIVPTLESGRRIKIDNKDYNFIDKFIIYYLNTPVFYYGGSSEAENKIRAFLVYNSILDGDDNWETILYSGINVKYIIRPHVIHNEKGMVYLPKIDKDLDKRLNESTLYIKVFTGEYFDLYKAKNDINYDTSIMLDVSFGNISSYLKNNLISKSELYFPLQTSAFLKDKKSKILLTDNSERAYYNLLSLLDGTVAHIYPASDLLPFSDAFVPSTVYTSAPLSLGALSIKDLRNFFGRPIPDMINLTSSQFIGIIDDNFQLNFPFKIQDSGNFRLLIKASTPNNSITGILSGKNIKFKRMFKYADSDSKEMFSYFYADYAFVEKGNFSLRIENNNYYDKPLLIESLSVVPQSLIYQKNSSWVGSNRMKLIQAGGPSEYYIESKKD